MSILSLQLDLLIKAENGYGRPVRHADAGFTLRSSNPTIDGSCRDCPTLYIRARRCNGVVSTGLRGLHVYVLCHVYVNILQ